MNPPSPKGKLKKVSKVTVIGPTHANARNGLKKLNDDDAHLKPTITPRQKHTSTNARNTNNKKPKSQKAKKPKRNRRS